MKQQQHHRNRQRQARPMWDPVRAFRGKAIGNAMAALLFLAVCTVATLGIAVRYVSVAPKGEDSLPAPPPVPCAPGNGSGGNDTGIPPDQYSGNVDLTTLTNLTHTCWGIIATSPQACSGAGQCVWYNECDCMPPWTGKNCEQLINNGTWCYGVPATDAGVCTGNGQCIAPDTCQCSVGFSGVKCDFDRAAAVRRVSFANIDVVQRMYMNRVLKWDAYTQMLTAGAGAFFERAKIIMVSFLSVFDAIFADTLVSDLYKLGAMDGRDSDDLSPLDKAAVFGAQSTISGLGYYYINADRYANLVLEGSNAYAQYAASGGDWATYVAPALNDWKQWAQACATEHAFEKPMDCMVVCHDWGLFGSNINAETDRVLAELVKVYWTVAGAAANETGGPGTDGNLSPNGIPLLNGAAPAMFSPTNVVAVHSNLINALGGKAEDGGRIVVAPTYTAISGGRNDVYDFGDTRDLRLSITVDDVHIRSPGVVMSAGWLAGEFVSTANTDPTYLKLILHIAERVFTKNGIKTFYGYQVSLMEGMLNSTWPLVEQAFPGAADPNVTTSDAYRVLNRAGPTRSAFDQPLGYVIMLLTQLQTCRDFFNSENGVTAENFRTTLQQRYMTNLGRVPGGRDGLDDNLSFLLSGAFVSKQMGALGWMVMSRAFEKAVQQQPQIAEDLRAGSIGSLNAWMKTNVFDVVPLHAYVLDLVEILTGERRLNGDALIRHFVNKYNRLYNMTMEAPAMPAGETYIFV
jgi:hypothetical protein